MELDQRPSEEEEAMAAMPKVVEESQVVEESGQQEREHMGESEAEDRSENEYVPDKTARVRIKKKREGVELSKETGKLFERWSKQEKGATTLAGLVSSRAQRHRRMIEEQLKERTEGKMSGITLSLPRTFSYTQVAAKEQANTVKKLRSYAGITTDQALRQPSLKEATFMMDFMMDDGSAKERERLSREHIAKINAKIENILFSVDSSLLGTISEFVAASGRRRAPSGQHAGMGGDDELDLLLEQLAKPAKLEIPTALLFVGVNVPDHDRMFAQLAQSLRSGGQRVASLRSKDCKMMLKPIIKSLVVQFIGSNPAFSVKEGKATMRALQYWYKTKGWQYVEPAAESASLAPIAESMEVEGTKDAGCEPPLVVVIEDFEAFDADVLKELISILSYYQADIPFVLVLGLATSADALHRMLPRSVSGRLATRKFTFHSSSESFEEIFKEVIMRNDMGVQFGYKTVEWVLDSFYSLHLSIQSLQRELTLATIEHFWRNHLAFLCRSLHDDDFFDSVGERLSAVHLDHIQRTKSVAKELRLIKQTGAGPSPAMIQRLKALKTRRRALQAKQSAAAVGNSEQTSGTVMDVADDSKQTSAEEPSSAEENATAPAAGQPIKKENEDEDEGGEAEMDVEVAMEVEMDVGDAKDEAESYNIDEITEWELLEVDPDYLRVKTAVWLDDIRRLHRNSHVMRECAVALVTLEGRSADDITRKEIFRHCLPTPDFFRMQSGHAPALRFDKFSLPVRSAFVNSRLFLSAVHAIKSSAMELAPLTQLLRDFHAILSVAHDFQPFDYDTAEESSIAAGMPGNEAPPVRRASRSSDQTKQLLLADIERLRERLQARVDALTKQTNDENATPSTSANSTPLRRSSNYVPPQSPYAQASPYTPRTHVLRKGTSSKRIAAWMESWTDDIEQQLKQDLQAFLIRFFSSQLPAYCVFPLHEVFYYNATDRLDECFNAAPLTTVKQALSQPEGYLGFSSLSWPAEHIDTAIAFELYKGQGKVINLKDWFDAFCERMKPDMFEMVPEQSEDEKPAKRRKTAATTASAKKKPAATPRRQAAAKRGAGKAAKKEAPTTDNDSDDETVDVDNTGSESESKTKKGSGSKKKKTKMVVSVRPDVPADQQAELLARFLTAIGELQMLGFMCPPPAARRKEVLMKMALGGRTA